MCSPEQGNDEPHTQLRVRNKEMKFTETGVNTQHIGNLRRNKTGAVGLVSPGELPCPPPSVSFGVITHGIVNEVIII